MINSLRGKVISIGEESIVVDVSGFGLEVFASGTLISMAALSEDLFCFAYMQLSDAGASLFGFSDERERLLFTELLQVKTIGGKLAVTLLRHLDADQILSAISAGDCAMLTVPGLGAKRAERICFELKNKIAKKFGAIGAAGEKEGTEGSSDTFVLEALLGLGFSQGESVRAITKSKTEAGSDAPLSEEELLRASLNLLRRN